MPISTSDEPGPGVTADPHNMADMTGMCQAAVDASHGHKENMAGYVAMKASVPGA